MYETFARSLGLFFDNRLNPILVRELRRMVRSRFIVIMLNLYILLLVMVCLIGITLNASTFDAGFGKGLFATLAGIMGFVSFLVVIVYTGIVGASERINADLMYTSTIKPSRIIFGKFISGLVLSSMLFSAAFPFFTLAYLLRGLDFYTFLMTVYLIFLAIHTANAVVILISCNIRTPLQMIFAGLITVFFILPVIFQAFVALIATALFGAGFFTLARWEFLTCVTTASLSIVGFFLIAGIVSVSPGTSNRAVPMRLFLSAWFVVSLPVYSTFSYFFLSVTGYSSHYWVGLHMVLLGVMLPFLCSERDFWSLRIRRTIPRALLFRLSVFPFYTGAACAITWWLGYAGVLFLFSLVVLSFYPAPVEFFYGTILLVFVFDYCVTALLLRTWVFPRVLTPGKTCVIAVVLLMLSTIGSMLAHFLIHYRDDTYNPLMGYEDHIISVLNPFVIFSTSPVSRQMPLQGYGAFIWAAFLTPLLIGWLLRRAVRFSPRMPDEILTYERALDILGIREKPANALPDEAVTSNAAMSGSR